MTLSYEELAQRLDRLTTRVEGLEAENAQLRAAVAAESSTEPTDGPSEHRRLDRRNLLRLGGAAAAVGAGAMMLRPSPAGATTAAMNFGTDNDADTDATGLTSSSTTDTLHVANTSTGDGTSGVALTVHNSDAANTASALTVTHDGTGLGDGSGTVARLHATNATNQASVLRVTQDGSADAIVTEVTTLNGGAGLIAFGLDGGGVIGVTNGAAAGVIGISNVGATGAAMNAVSADTNNAAPALDVEHDGKGQAIFAHLESATNAKVATTSTTRGTGGAIVGSINNVNSKATAVQCTTNGSGAGLAAVSSKGVGAVFKGLSAQIQMYPAAASTHPTVGSAGQLFVDHSGRLWYCRGGRTWKQLA